MVENLLFTHLTLRSYKNYKCNYKNNIFLLLAVEDLVKTLKKLIIIMKYLLKNYIPKIPIESIIEC